MQSGDLAGGSLGEVLRSLASDSATGGIHIQRRGDGRDAGTRDAVLYLHDGHLYAATSPGPRPLLGVRLVAAGAVTREALQEALESQAGDLAGWRLGELLVHLGYVDADIVTEFVIEQILDTVGEVLSWPTGGWRFQRGERIRGSEDLALDINAVLSHIAKRLDHLTTLAAAGSADSVPLRLSFDSDLAAAQIPLAQTLLSVIDGHRTIAELAVRCGLTTFEAGQVLALLVESGAVALREPAETAGAEKAPAASAEDAGTAVTDDDLSALLSVGDDDLGMQLAVLARQAEEARFAAEARRREEITSRRRAAREPVEPTADERPVVAPGVEEDASTGEQVAPLPAADDLPLAYDHLDALAAAVAEATLTAPQQPTPFASEGFPQSEFEPADHGDSGYDDAAEGGVAALRYLAASGFTPETDDEPAPAADRSASAAGGSYEPADRASDGGGNPFVDSAALLRELSSLGLDDAPAARATTRAPAPRAPVSVQARPKRKSIFGR